MGRRKVEIKRIEDKTSRQVTFSKRRAGLIKKAKQFAVLCDADVAAVVVSSRGKPFDFCSTGSLDNLLHRYHSHMKVHGEEVAGVNAETSSPEAKGFLSFTELLEQVKRVSEQPDVDHLNLSDLVHLEEQLEDALSQIRSKKRHGLMQSITGLTETDKILTEENRQLRGKIAESKNAAAVNVSVELLAGDEIK